MVADPKRNRKVEPSIDNTHNMSHNGTALKEVTGKGTGVFAERWFLPDETVIVSRRIRARREPTRHTVQLDVELHVELDSPARSLNHSCDPNTRVRPNGHAAFDFVARRPIAPGEEIAFDYETTEHELKCPFECSCLSAGCRQTIRGAKFRPVARSQ